MVAHRCIIEASIGKRIVQTIEAPHGICQFGRGNWTNCTPRKLLETSKAYVRHYSSPAKQSVATLQSLAKPKPGWSNHTDTEVAVHECASDYSDFAKRKTTELAIRRARAEAKSAAADVEARSKQLALQSYLAYKHQASAYDLPEPSSVLSLAMLAGVNMHGGTVYVHWVCPCVPRKSSSLKNTDSARLAALPSQTN
jgi:hypothetical protein